MMKKIFNFIKKKSKFLFIIYLFVLFLVLVMKFPQMDMFEGIVHRWETGTRSRFMTETNYVPFKVIINYVKQVHSLNDWFIKNLACNIIMFIPFGFLVPLFMKKNKLWQVIIYGIILSIIIEFIQVILIVGTGDVDDVILNSFGLLMGFGIYKLIYSVALKNSLE